MNKMTQNQSCDRLIVKKMESSFFELAVVVSVSLLPLSPFSLTEKFPLTGERKEDPETRVAKKS